MTLGLTTPAAQPPPGITHNGFSPIRFRSPLLTESLLFSLPAGTEMFHFPAFPLTAYTFSSKSHTTTACGVSPFGHPGLNTRLSAPPGLSQIPTSFIGSYCQGIHHAPLNTYTHVQATRTQNNRILCRDKNKMLASTMQFPNNNPHHHHHNHKTGCSYLKQGQHSKPQSREPNSAPTPTTTQGRQGTFIDIPPMSKTTSTTTGHSSGGPNSGPSSLERR